MTDHLISTMLNASETDNACARCRGICIPIPMVGWQYDHNSIQQTLEGRQNGCSFCSLLTLALGLNPGPGTIAMKAWKDEITPSTTQNYDYYFEARVHSLSDTSSHSPTRATFKLNPLLDSNGSRAQAVGSLPNPNTLEAFGRARNWLNHCVSTHSCAPETEPQLPNRVIDLGGPSLARLRLFVPPPGKRARYAALSYCWGSSPAFITSSANFEDNLRGFSLTDLPGTIIDAVKITRQLRLRYLWVDALCIIQGSDAAATRDWTRESALMKEVYSKAHITIAAAAARNCSDGIFNTRSCVVPIRSDIMAATRGEVTIHISDHIAEFKDEPINNRAWTLQERLLSTRLLTYTTQEMSWQCNAASFGDNTTNFMPDQTARGFSPSSWHTIYKYRLPSPPASPRWRVIVQNYCSRSLTNSRDKLPALSGLAQQYHLATGDRYLAGLWEQTLATDLLWINDEHFRAFNAAARSYVPDLYVAPSWSWAAISGNIVYTPFHDIKSSDMVVSVSHCSVEHVNPLDPYGMVSDARLVIAGPMKKATRIGWKDDEETARMEADGSWNSTPVVFAHSEDTCQEFLLGNIWLDGDDRAAVRRAADIGSVYCLLMAKRWFHYGLVLLPTDTNHEVFVRIGLFVAADPLSQQAWFNDAANRKITIV
ncbi:heterokaryon incompatibility protein-domain-containing protein [Paraphoma chrysanthemicola]|nr:heterokaryon incompatibility protein-domain-containing protein [Paraphoma chrysanthemicola]